LGLAAINIGDYQEKRAMEGYLPHLACLLDRLRRCIQGPKNMGTEKG